MAHAAYEQLLKNEDCLPDHSTLAPIGLRGAFAVFVPSFYYAFCSHSEELENMREVTA